MEISLSDGAPDYTFFGFTPPKKILKKLYKDIAGNSDSKKILILALQTLQELGIPTIRVSIDETVPSINKIHNISIEKNASYREQLSDFLGNLIYLTHIKKIVESEKSFIEGMKDNLKKLREDRKSLDQDLNRTKKLRAEIINCTFITYRSVTQKNKWNKIDDIKGSDESESWVHVDSDADEAEEIDLSLPSGVMHESNYRERNDISYENYLRGLIDRVLETSKTDKDQTITS